MNLKHLLARRYNVSAETPPCFLVQAEGDVSVVVDYSSELRAALREHGRPVETYLFTHGGHGCSLRIALSRPVSVWPELFV